MYGAVPAIFKNQQAAEKAGEAYTLEEGKEYCIMAKTTDWGTVYYKPVQVSCIGKAKAEDWTVISVLTT